VLLLVFLLVAEFLRMPQASLDQLGGTSVQRFADQVAIPTQSQEHLLTQYDLEKTFRFILQSGAPPALRLTKLNPAFFALLGGELRHLVFFIISSVKAKSSAFH
jgi:hypothetical protein